MRRASVVLAAFALACPLVAVPGTGWDVYRLSVVLAIDAVLLAHLFLRSSRGGDCPPGPAPLRTAAFILVGVQGLSAVFARSRIDTVEPIFILTAGVLLYCCMRGGLLRREPALALIPVISGVALIVACIGIVQKLSKVEAVATEGNRNYAGALCAMLLPPSVAFTRAGKPWARALAALAAAALLVELLISESRSGLLGTLAGLLLVAWALWRGKVPRGAPIAVAALVVVAGSFALTQGKEQISQTRLDTIVFRLEAWKSGLRMLAQRPVLGWGAGSFRGEYPPFRSAKEFEISHSDGREGFVEVEDPHSTWICAAAETGVVGLAALLLVVYVAARLWRYYVRKAADPESAALLAGLGGGAAAFLVSGGFNTLTLHVSHTVLFWGFLALMEVLGDPRPWRTGSRVREARAAIPAAAAVTALFSAFLSLRAAQAESAFVEAMKTTSATAREQLLRQVVEINPHAWQAHDELARSLSAMGRYAGAAAEGRLALARRPHQVEVLNQTAISISRAAGDGAESDRLLRHAIEVAPYYYKSPFNLGMLEAQRAHLREARELFAQSIEHKPDHGASYYYRGLMAFMEGDVDAAVADFRMARGLKIDVGAALRTDRPSAVSDPRLAEFFK